MELTQGSKTSPAHDGQATLSPWKVSKPRIIHFDRQSDFWKPRWHKSKLQTFQERLGGRIALVAEISIQGVSIICHNLHLGRRLNDELRLVQSNEVLQDAGVYDSTKLVVVAGDLNLNASKPVMADALARAGFRMSCQLLVYPLLPHATCSKPAATSTGLSYVVRASGRRQNSQIR